VTTRNALEDSPPADSSVPSSVAAGHLEPESAARNLSHCQTNIARMKKNVFKLRQIELGLKKPFDELEAQVKGDNLDFPRSKQRFVSIMATWDQAREETNKGQHQLSALELRADFLRKALMPPPQVRNIPYHANRLLYFKEDLPE
jgi:hypothetical protein